jgi:hypothetical protein
MVVKIHVLTGEFLALEAEINFLFSIAGSHEAFGPEAAGLGPTALATSGRKGREELFEGGIIIKNGVNKGGKPPGINVKIAQLFFKR